MLLKGIARACRVVQADEFSVPRHEASVAADVKVVRLEVGHEFVGEGTVFVILGEERSGFGGNGPEGCGWVGGDILLLLWGLWWVCLATCMGSHLLPLQLVSVLVAFKVGDGMMTRLGIAGAKEMLLLRNETYTTQD